MTKIPETRQLKQKTVFLTVLEGEKPNIKALADLAFAENLLPGLFDRESSQVGREAGREREEEAGSPAEQRARCGTRSQDPEITT